jgi:hypothetical protein
MNGTLNFSFVRMQVIYRTDDEEAIALYIQAINEDQRADWIEALKTGTL